MSIGYACIHIGAEETKLTSLRLKNLSADRMRAAIEKNLRALQKIIDYNKSYGIKLFRISSNIIPFGSHPANDVAWWKEYASELREIGTELKEAGIRVSMHPGQYTVLNSARSDVAARAIADLEYHCKYLESLETDTSSKVVLHVGGVYAQKGAAINRFIESFKALPVHIRERIPIENDEQSYHVQDVLQISQ